MPVILPTFVDQGHYHWQYSIDLDARGSLHRLACHFERLDNLSPGTDGAWYLDTFDAAGDPLLLGLRLTLGRDKYAPYRYRPGMPQGQLHVIDTTGAGLQASSTDLGSRVVLQYTPP